MKKKIVFTSAIGSLCAVVIGVQVNAYAALDLPHLDPDSGFFYTLNDEHISIDEFNRFDSKFLKEIIIPETLLGYPVNAIGADAFYGAGFENITIPDSIEYIGTGAFRDCDDLIEIYLPDSVKSLGGSVFSECLSLTEITLPNKIKELKYQAFHNCPNLIDVHLPDGLEIIDDDAFSGCKKLSSIEIPDSVYSIGSDAFDYTEMYNNENNWHDNGLYIDNWFIEADPSLQSVQIKDCKGIVGGAFFGSIAEKITISDSVIYISTEAFYNCFALEDITIPASVQKIGKCAFEECKNLTSITILNPYAEIGDYAFGYNYDEKRIENDLVIKGVKGSTAEAYAKENNIAFEYLSYGETSTESTSMPIDTDAGNSDNNQPQTVEDSNKDDRANTVLPIAIGGAVIGTGAVTAAVIIKKKRR